MATTAQRARTSEYQSRLSNLQNSLKTATGTQADALQRSINRTQSALAKISPTQTATPQTPSQSLNYSYSPGSAAGPATLQQAQTAIATGTPVNIPRSRPAGTPSLPTAPTIPTAPTAPIQQQTPQQPDMISTIKNITEQLYPQIPQQQAYQSPFASDIQKTLGAITGFQGQQYQPEQDIGLQQAQEQAIAQTMRQAARRNMLYSEGTKSRAQQVAQQLIPQYQERFEDRQQQQLDNLYRTLGVLGDVEQRDYQRYRDTGEIGQQAYSNQMAALRSAQGLAGDITAQQASQRQLSQQTGDDLRERYKDMFGRYLSDREIGYAEAYTNASPQMLEYLDSVGGDYQAEINRLKSMGETNDSPYIQALHGARMHKIQNDFEMGMLYGRDYGLEPPQAEQKQYFDAIIKDMDAQIKSITADNEIAKSYLDIDKLKADIFDKEISTQEKMRRIAEMGERMELEQRQMADRERQTSIKAASQATAASREGRLATQAQQEQAQKRSPYYSSIVSAIDKTIDDFAQSDPYNNQTLDERVRMTGTAENKRIVDLINRSIIDQLITPNEGELLYNSYGIPIPD